MLVAAATISGSVADTANGMGGLVVPPVFERLPMTLVHLFPELDGTFPNHPADPIDPANQRDLKRELLERPADIGSVQAVVVDAHTGKQYGGADARREGTVIGLPRPRGP